MEDDDNLDNINIEEIDKDLYNLENSNLEQDNNILDKERLSENSKNEVQLKSRFTVVDKNFFEEPNDKKDDSVNLSKNNDSMNNSRNSKAHEEKKHKKEKKSEKVDKTFINLKIILVGDVSVGKTSIIERYINNDFQNDYICTIQCEQKTKIITEDLNTSIRMNIWDTVGQEKYRSLTRQYYRDCQGVIIVFDITRKQTFDYLQIWIDEITQYCGKDTPIIVIGNKSDLIDKREVSENNINEKLNDEYKYFEVSAKNGNNVALAFNEMKKLIMENRKKKNEEENKDGRNTKKSKNNKDRNREEERRSQSLDEMSKHFNEKNKKCC